MSPQKANAKVFVKSENMSIVSPMCKSEKQWYIHYLLDLPHSRWIPRILETEVQLLVLTSKYSRNNNTLF